MLSLASDFLEFSQVASLYSQLAGVLAGFAFAALIAVATVRVNSSQYDANITSAYRPLMCSFFSLVMASLNYAIVSGEKDRSGRSAAVEASAGLSFCAAGCVLVFSILVTLASVESVRPDPTGNARKTVDFVRRLLAVAVPPLFVLLFLPAVSDHALAKYEDGRVPFALQLLAYLLVGFSILSSLALALAYKRLALRRNRADHLSVPGLIVAILATLATNAFIVFMRQDTRVSDVVPAIELVVVTALGFVTSIVACRFQVECAEPKAEPGDGRIELGNGHDGQEATYNALTGDDRAHRHDTSDQNTR